MGEGQSRLLDQGPGPDPPEALTASGPKRRTWIGSGASYCITTNDTQGIESAKRPARLRVKDVDFTRGEIVVRQGKGGKDRMTMLPQNDAVPL